MLKFLYHTYYRIKKYLYFKNFEKIHLTFGTSNGKFQITRTNHVDFVATAQKEIDKLAKTKTGEELITEALKISLDGCNFIIFTPEGEDKKFVHFWTGEHQLKFKFIAHDGNKLKNLFLSTIGLLSEMGFVNDSIPDYRGHKVFKIDKGRDYISVDANFKKDIDLATEFTKIIFKQLFKVGRKKLIARVE